MGADKTGSVKALVEVNSRITDPPTTLFFLIQKIVSPAKNNYKSSILNRCIQPKMHCRLYRKFVCFV